MRATHMSSTLTTLSNRHAISRYAARILVTRKRYHGQTSMRIHPTCTHRSQTVHAGTVAVCALLALVTAIPAFSQINIQRFDASANVTLVGDAMFRNNALLLTRPRGIGAAWFGTRQPVGSGFITAFKFKISLPAGGPDYNLFDGGDGIAFVVQTSSPQAIGQGGGEIGYGGIARSVAVEFDTYFNFFPEADGNDLTSNHVSVHSRGALANSGSEAYSLASNFFIRNLSDGEIHTAVIEWDNDLLRVFIDDCYLPVITKTLAIPDMIGEPLDSAWVGFTAATGVAWEFHEILSWRLASLNEFTTIELCDGDGFELTAPPGFDDYFWSNGYVGRTIRVQAPGSYSVTMGGTDFCGRTITRNFFVAKRGALRPTIAGETYICADSTTVLDAGAGFLSYLWSTGERTRTIRIKGPALVYVDAIDSSGCLMRSDSLLIGIRRAPRPAITPAGPIRLCTGDSVALDAGRGFVKYLWDDGDTNRIKVVRDAGVFRVLVTDSAGCSAESPVVNVLMHASPIVSVTPRSAAFCEGGSVPLLVSGAATYRWSPSSGLSCVDCADPVASPDSTTTYVVTATSSEGCIARDSVVVTVVPRTTADAGRDTGICVGDSAQLHAAPALTYLWSPSNGLSCTTCRDPYASPATTTMYRLRVNDGTLCAADDSALVIVHAPPIVDAGSSVSLCLGDSAKLEADGGVAWKWSPPDGLNCSDCRAPVARPTRTTLYSLQGFSKEGCTATDTVTVVVHSPPTADAGPDAEVCTGQSIQLEAKGGARYDWSPTEGLSCGDCAAPVASPIQTTRYSVVVTNSDGCQDSDEVNVTVRPLDLIDVRIEQGIRATLGAALRVPVLVRQGAPRGWPTMPIDVTLSVDERIVRIGDVDTRGTLLDASIASTLEQSPGTIRMRFVPNPTVARSDTLLLVDLFAYLGPVASSAITLEIESTEEPCERMSLASGSMRVDSVCGLDWRLLELSAAGYSLAQNRPNPVTSTTTIEFSIAFLSHTRLVVVDAWGNSVATLVDEPLAAGTHTFSFDASLLPSGVYSYRIEAGHYRSTRSLSIVK